MTYRSFSFPSSFLALNGSFCSWRSFRETFFASDFGSLDNCFSAVSVSLISIELQSFFNFIERVYASGFAIFFSFSKISHEFFIGQYIQRFFPAFQILNRQKDCLRLAAMCDDEALEVLAYLLHHVIEIRACITDGQHRWYRCVHTRKRTLFRTLCQCLPWSRL